jgi:hypothetical protein
MWYVEKKGRPVLTMRLLVVLHSLKHHKGSDACLPFALKIFVVNLL